MMGNQQNSTPRSGTAIDRRRVLPADKEFIDAVYAGTRDEEMNWVDWTTEQKNTFLRSQCEAQRQDYERRYPDSIHEIVLFKDRPVGRIWVARPPTEIRLIDIAILPEYRGRGIGSALIKELQREAAGIGKPMRHCVLNSNWAALIFYERLGFRKIDEESIYCLMEWRPEGNAAPSEKSQC